VLISLIDHFQSFYYELLRQKEKALRQCASFPITVGQNHTPEDQAKDQSKEGDDGVVLKGEMEDPNLPKIVESIQIRLRDILHKQSQDLEMAVGLGNATAFKDAQYLMAALADEIFLNLPWSGVRVWENSLLESQFFQTQIAGEYVFKKLDSLLANNSPEREDMALLYFMALSLGFRGMYNDEQGKDKIRSYLESLYKIAQGRLPRHLRAEKYLLIEQCYQHNLGEVAQKSLPDNRSWFFIILSVIFVYVFISYIVWHSLSSDVQNALNTIFQQVKAMPE